MKVLNVVLGRRLMFHKHVSVVAGACSYHAQAICHIRHLLSMELAQTFVCSQILSQIDYCNIVLHGTPVSTNQKLQQIQNSAAWIVLQASRRSYAKLLLQQLHWLPVQQRITYELAVRTYKVNSSQLWFTYIAESWNVSAAELYVHLPPCCWSNHSPGQTFPDVLSGFQHCLPGNCCH